MISRRRDELVQAVRRSGIKFMISLPSRTRPETLFMRTALDEGLLGDVTMMRARVAHSAALDGWFKGGSAWFGDAALAGGGSLFDLGCHTVDVMRWFLGEPESVTAMTTNFAKAYDIDDQCIALVRFKNGALGILDVSWVHRAGPNTTEKTSWSPLKAFWKLTPNCWTVFPSSASTVLITGMISSRLLMAI